MWEFFPSGGPPPPPPCLGMTRLFEEKNHVFFCILGGVSHVKNSKKWKWDSGRPPPPCFFKIPTFSRLFFWGASLTLKSKLFELIHSAAACHLETSPN